MKSYCNRLRSVTALFFIFFLFSLSSLAGQEIPGVTLPDSARYDSDVSPEDLPEIQVTALKDKAAAERWWYGWLAGYTAATAGQGVVFFTSDSKTLRQDMALGAATTFLGAMGQLITPVLSEESDYPSYREYSSGEKSLSAEQAAGLLKALAVREKEGRSWKTHAIAGVVNLGSGLITWLGYNRTFMDGLENFALNTLITEAQIWTQPMKAVRDYEKYCQKTGPGTETMTSGRDGEWSWSIHPGGFYVRYVF
ncbi:MAG: hypothetical protein RBT50_12545 [Bacteroidales bacterium]|jgi:hypothetical protein|nr:hypothetical protein [Bacteroidales bacterium]